MRLIDADAFAENMDNLPEYWKDIVDDQPTIDAIPVSFIEEKMREIEETYLIVDGLIEAEPDPEYCRTGIYKKLLHEYNALRDLISAWKERKEE